jgi:hypothetical protein
MTMETHATEAGSISLLDDDGVAVRVPIPQAFVTVDLDVLCEPFSALAFHRYQ